MAYLATGAAGLMVGMIILYDCLQLGCRRGHCVTFNLIFLHLHDFTAELKSVEGGNTVGYACPAPRDYSHAVIGLQVVSPK